MTKIISRMQPSAAVVNNREPQLFSAHALCSLPRQSTAPRQRRFHPLHRIKRPFNRAKTAKTKNVKNVKNGVRPCHLPAPQPSEKTHESKGSASFFQTAAKQLTPLTPGFSLRISLSMNFLNLFCLVSGFFADSNPYAIA